MALFSKVDVTVGDRFTKVGQFRMLPIWKVARIRDESQPAHVHLEREGTRETITVSLPALADTSLFRRVTP